MLSPRDLDLLLVRSCSLSPSLSLWFALRAPTAFKAPISPIQPSQLTARINTQLAVCVGIDAIETLEKLHFLPAHFWAHFHHFYRLQIVSRKSTAVHERYTYYCSPPQLKTRISRATRITTSHIHTHTREQRGDTTKHTKAALLAG